MTNANGSIEVRLEEENDSGEAGTATLTAVDDERTRVEIELDGSDTPHPAFIHENACDRIDPTPTDRLDPVVDGQSNTVIGVALEHFRTSPHAIAIHASEDPLDNYTACGTVGEVAPLPSG